MKAKVKKKSIKSLLIVKISHLFSRTIVLRMFSCRGNDSLKAPNNGLYYDSFCFSISQCPSAHMS